MSAVSPQDDRPVDSILAPEFRGLTIGLLVVVFGAAFESLAVATIMPRINAQIGGIKLYGWVFSAFMLANLVGITVAGGEADRHGPARPYAVGISIFVIGLVLAGLSWTMPLFVIARGIQGFGAGTIYAMAYVCIGRAYPPSLRPRMIASLSSAWVIPGLIGPSVASLVAETLGWRWVMLGLAPIPVIAASLALPAMRKLNVYSGKSLDLKRIRSAIQLAVGAGLALESLAIPGLIRTPILLLPGLFLLLPALRAVMPSGFFRVAPGLPAAIVSTGLLNMAFFGTDVFLPLALTSIRGRTLTEAGLVVTSATLFWSSGSFIQSRFSPTSSRRRMIQIGALILSVGIALTALLLHSDVPVILAPALWGCAGLGMGIAYSTNGLIIIESSPKGGEGLASSSMQISNALGVALGSGIGGVLVGAAGNNIASRQHAIGLVYTLTVITALSAIAVATRLPARPASAEFLTDPVPTQ